MLRRPGCDSRENEELSKFTVLTIGPPGGGVALEAPHTLHPAFDTAIVPPNPVVQIGAGWCQTVLPSMVQTALEQDAWPFVVTRSGRKLMVIRAERKCALAAFVAVGDDQVPSQSVAQTGNSSGRD